MELAQQLGRGKNYAKVNNSLITMGRESRKSKKSRKSQEFLQRLKKIRNQPENQCCADCDEKNPEWASIMAPLPGGKRGMGILCCYKCCNYHIVLGRGVCEVKNLKTVDKWTDDEVRALEEGGNDRINAIYERNLNRAKPCPSDDDAQEKFIRAKYHYREFFCTKAYEAHQGNFWFTLQEGIQQVKVMASFQEGIQQLQQDMAPIKVIAGTWGKENQGNLSLTDEESSCELSDLIGSSRNSPSGDDNDGEESITRLKNEESLTIQLAARSLHSSRHGRRGPVGARRGCMGSNNNSSRRLIGLLEEDRNLKDADSSTTQRTPLAKEPSTRRLRRSSGGGEDGERNFKAANKLTMQRKSLTREPGTLRLRCSSGGGDTKNHSSDNPDKLSPTKTPDQDTARRHHRSVQRSKTFSEETIKSDQDPAKSKHRRSSLERNFKTENSSRMQRKSLTREPSTGRLRRSSGGGDTKDYSPDDADNLSPIKTPDQDTARRHRRSAQRSKTFSEETIKSDQDPAKSKRRRSSLERNFKDTKISTTQKKSEPRTGRLICSSGGGEAAKKDSSDNAENLSPTKTLDQDTARRHRRSLQRSNTFSEENIKPDDPAKSKHRRSSIRRNSTFCQGKDKTKSSHCRSSIRRNSTFSEGLDSAKSSHRRSLIAPGNNAHSEGLDSVRSSHRRSLLPPRNNTYSEGQRPERSSHRRSSATPPRNNNSSGGQVTAKSSHRRSSLQRNITFSEGQTTTCQRPIGPSARLRRPSSFASKNQSNDAEERTDSTATKINSCEGLLVRRGSSHHSKGSVTSNASRGDHLDPDSSGSQQKSHHRRRTLPPRDDSLASISSFYNGDIDIVKVR